MYRGNTALSDGTWFKTTNSPVQIFLCPLLDSDWNLVELLVFVTNQQLLRGYGYTRAYIVKVIVHNQLCHISPGSANQSERMYLRRKTLQKVMAFCNDHIGTNEAMHHSTEGL